MQTFDVQKKAMNISLAVGFAMLIAKWIAYLLTQSVVIFSDAAESIVHVVAVWFAWYALRVTAKPPDDDHPYGHDKIGFVSAGVEGVLICIAGFVIIGTAMATFFNPRTLHNLDYGIYITIAAACVNGMLGWYLLKVGKQGGSIVVIANGKHVLADVWTSGGAVIGLSLAMYTGYTWLDPVIAIVFSMNIIREGFNLVTDSVRGLMDTADLDKVKEVRSLLDRLSSDHDCSYHRLRMRNAGYRIHVDYHLQVPDEMSMHDGHALATAIEDRIRELIGENTEVFTHLESSTQPEGHV